MVMKHSFKKLSETIKEANEMLREPLADHFLLDQMPSKACGYPFY